MVFNIQNFFLFTQCMYVYLGLRARQHLRSLAPMWNDAWLWWPNDIRGLRGPKASWHSSYRWGKTPKKTSPRKLVPTGDRTRARCVTSAHATTCSTAVDGLMELIDTINRHNCVYWANETTIIIEDKKVNNSRSSGMVWSVFQMINLAILHRRDCHGSDLPANVGNHDSTS